MEAPMRRVLLLVAVLPLGFAPVPKPKPGPLEGDLKALQGEWVLSRRASFGEWTDGGATAVVAGDRITFRDGTGPNEWKIKLGADKEVKTCDLEAVNVADVKKGTIEAGMYTLDRGAFTLCRYAVDVGRLNPRVIDGRNPVLIVEVYKRKRR
jgi:uncharacterized protein (TIGR03067 family)